MVYLKKKHVHLRVRLCFVYFSGTLSKVKLKLEQRGFNFNKCANIYREHGVNLTDGQLCAGGVEGQGTCDGDLGALITFCFEIHCDTMFPF